MNKVNRPIVCLLFIVSILSASCSAGNQMGGTSKKCGCGSNKGFVGY
jgi:hypothetical protein